MDSNIREVKNKNDWENFLLKITEKTFLQSWNWGEFQKMLGNKIWRLGIFDNSGLLGIAQVVKIEARRGKFLFVPHGPNIKSNPNAKCQILEVLIKKLKEIAKEENCSFIRIAPIWEKNEENEKIFKDLGFRNAPIHIHPELTWELDITPREDDLLMNMRKTTRYLIKQGLRNKDLKIEKSKNLKDIEIFNALYQKTVNKHHFVPFSQDYLEKEFRSFACAQDSLRSAQNDSDAVIFLANYKGEYLASAMIIFWQGTAFYHQGASVQKYSKIPASYLLQWEAIREAKNRACKIYNFWGIAPENSKKNHPWWGLSLFKKGFGGQKKEYLKTQDLPLSVSYWLTFAFEKIRKIKRNL